MTIDEQSCFYPQGVPHLKGNRKRDCNKKKKEGKKDYRSPEERKREGLNMLGKRLERRPGGLKSEVKKKRKRG